tara:strand:- start:4393 stop:5004 length:612 start_codon:yes stop_codon:yes gene_type:complete
MFSGIVQGKGKVLKITTKKDHLSLEISFPEGFNKNLNKGASISVDGVCLTSLDDGQKNLNFDIIEETISRTNLGSLKQGSVVNLERSISASSEIGGHLMSGHIHFTGKVKSSLDKKNTKDIAIGFPKKFKKYIFEKGYIGINGCSLTIGKVTESYFFVHLIPETLAITNLGDLVGGCLVNIEIDQNTIAIVETVEKSLAAQKS